MHFNGADARQHRDFHSDLRLIVQECGGIGQKIIRERESERGEFTNEIHPPPPSPPCCLLQPVDFLVCYMYNFLEEG